MYDKKKIFLWQFFTNCEKKGVVENHALSDNIGLSWLVEEILLGQKTLCSSYYSLELSHYIMVFGGGLSCQIPTEISSKMSL